MRDLRRVVVGCVVGSFGVAALLGIIALLSGGEFDETQVRVLLTTVTVGATSVAMLCYLAAVGHRWAAVGALGGVAALICAGTALWWIWVPDSWLDGGPWQLFFTTLTLALTLAQASLLVAVADRDRLRVGLVLTLLLAGVVATMVIFPILTEDFADASGYWRAFGVVAILDVLGTLALVAMAVLGGRGPTVSTTGAELLSPRVQQRVIDLARHRGTTPDVVVTEALDAVAPPREPLQQ